MKLVTIRQLCEILQISRSKAYELSGDEIPVYRIGGALRFREDDIQEYLEGCRTESVEYAQAKKRKVNPQNWF